jgi:HTH-type transcriptional regulator/antitoxin HigA
MATSVLEKVRVGEDYLALTRRFPLVPIRNERHYRQAVRMLDELAVVDEHDLTCGQADYLMVLTDIVERWEREHHAIDTGRFRGLDALKHLLEENRMSASDLGRLLGNRQLGSAILRGQRQLSKTHLRVLAERFAVHAELFI